MERGMNRAYIWGAARYGALAMAYCKDCFLVDGFIDRRAGETFRTFCGKPVITPMHFGKQNCQVKTLIIAVKYPAEVLEWIDENRQEMKWMSIYIFDGRIQENPLLYRVDDGEICVPQYMDKRFAECGEYAAHYSKLDPYILRMFTVAVGGVERYGKDGKICEIGCGSGQFANMLFDKGFSNYIGVDFSNQAVRMAQEANPANADRFVCCDAFAYLASCQAADARCFVMLEVLEHMKKDRELLDLLPIGSRLVFSVPSFESFNHMRRFDTLEDIKKRYGMLKIEEYQMLPASSVYVDKKYHLVFAEK